ncbi:NAD(P)H-dependent oxidoreductase [Rhodococcus sp. HNM0569]|uniref:NADPH-dependent FMN reductase n=1 Tax=Rhodococcus sp. HNM0569 TaxID=2716340 RepID=UPI00146ADF86|nr:NAD(P)H-dependent oxidoreductase [Rhodococcus sp. HNM0569]NLU81757.1 NAD(P)H-dependent oxidoreductase [Rhodococcus sp. HNM0569]
MTDDARIRLAVVVASTRPQRVAPRVAAWFTDHAHAHDDVEVSTIDLCDYPLPADLSPSEAGERLRRRVAESDAFVVVTSEYNHGYPASLKTAFDTVKHEWRSKPVGFVSYGGMAGGARATEQLRQVAVELHMLPVQQTVVLARIRRAFDEAGRLHDDVADDHARDLLAQLHWWAGAVRLRTERSSYPG